ncbi:hypothetical protein ACFW9N_28375 [Streptomyces sp. NPDC059496]|uniref:hypothetical protein n=1 Tax=Streptomyces sp. NPDC059496 TaxID=3346851 RepID=UPI0036782E26
MPAFHTDRRAAEKVAEQAARAVTEWRYRPLDERDFLKAVHRPRTRAPSGKSGPPGRLGLVRIALRQVPF